MSVRAIRVTRAADRGSPNRVALVELPDVADAPAPGDVLVDVEYSSLNFKDALALTGRPGVIRGEELTAGIDLVGVVSVSASDSWRPGDRVLVNGYGLGETEHGGLAEQARIDGSWVIRVPERMSGRQAAAVGTAGYTAALCAERLAEAGLGAGAEVVVTGAAGGVGTIALLLGRAAGWRITAVTGRPELAADLRAFGASEVLDRRELSAPGKPLQSARWDGAIDTVGGDMLANVLAQTRPGSTVTACGNAADARLSTTVMPFILRGVTLAGINSVEPPRAAREAAWRRLDRDLDLDALDSATEELALDEAIPAAARFFDGGVHGRLVVDVRRSAPPATLAP